MIKDLIKIANKLDNRGLFEEADKLDAIIREAQEREVATGRISALKILLKKVLMSHGYTAEEVGLNTRSNLWGNLNEAWFKFANHVLEISEVASNWAGVSRKIGRGYRPTIGGMMDLLEDFSLGGRALVGAKLDTLGEGALAEQTPERKKRLEGEVALHKGLRSLDLINPLVDKPVDSRYEKSRELQNLREQVETDARRALRKKKENQRPELVAPVMPDESLPNAMTGPKK